MFTYPGDGLSYQMVPGDAEEGDVFEACKTQTYTLLELQLNNWCNYSHSHQCSMVGAYQPSIPTGEDHGHFYGFAGYFHLWRFLQFPSSKVTLSEVEEAGRAVCAMSLAELEEFNSGAVSAEVAEANEEYLPYYCFLTSYVTSLLVDGFGFSRSHPIAFVDEISGYKVRY
ncbi:unnamed protein product [Choristocarpus tenellus]